MRHVNYNYFSIKDIYIYINIILILVNKIHWDTLAETNPKVKLLVLRH